MIRRSDAVAPPRRPGTVALLIAGLGCVALAVLPAAVTHAGFLSSVAGKAALSATVDIAQGAKCDEQYADPEHPRPVSASGTAAYLPRPSDAADVEAAKLELTYCTPSTASGAEVRLRIGEEGKGLLFAVSVGGASVVGPTTAAGLGETGVVLPAAPEPKTLVISVWIAPDAPPSAFGAVRQFPVTISVETTGGHTFELDVTS